MSIKTCMLCHVEITEENDSNEHVIPSALGGRKKVSKFICKNCNSILGEKWDSDLAKQLNLMCLLFDIKRDRGNVPPQELETTSGSKVVLKPNGGMDLPKPAYSETQMGDDAHIKIRARSLKEARHILNGVKRKYPHADTDALLSDAEVRSEYLSKMLKYNCDFGGQKAGRSLVKSAMSLVAESGVDVKDCEHAIKYLLNDDSEACFGYYYEKDLIINRPEAIPLHCVHVKGDPVTKQILGYVEYFGIWRMIMCLSSHYEGGDFVNTYSINPIDGSHIDINVQLEFSSDDIRAAYDYKKIPRGSIDSACEKVLSAALERSFKKELNRVISEAFEYARANCGAKEGEIMTREHMTKFTDLFMKKFEPFIQHLLSRTGDK